MPDTKHCFIRVGFEPNSVPFQAPSTFYWCSWCGTLTRNFVEYWRPHIILLDVGRGERRLPDGSHDEPACGK